MIAGEKHRSLDARKCRNVCGECVNNALHRELREQLLAGTEQPESRVVGCVFSERPEQFRFTDARFSFDCDQSAVPRRCLLEFAQQYGQLDLAPDEPKWWIGRLVTRRTRNRRSSEVTVA